MEIPETRYAVTADGAHIAYQVFGDGPLDVAVLQGLSHVERGWELPALRRFFERLSGFARVLIHDRRGFGASDPLPTSEPPNLEALDDDFVTLLDATGFGRPAVIGMTNGGFRAITFADASCRALRRPRRPRCQRAFCRRARLSRGILRGGGRSDRPREPGGVARRKHVATGHHRRRPAEALHAISTRRGRDRPARAQHSVVVLPRPPRRRRGRSPRRRSSSIAATASCRSRRDAGWPNTSRSRALSSSTASDASAPTCATATCSPIPSNTSSPARPTPRRRAGLSRCCSATLSARPRVARPPATAAGPTS